MPKTIKKQICNWKWLVKSLAPKLREQLTMNGREAYSHIKITYSVMVPDHLVLKALKEVREAVEDIEIEQYGI